MDQKLKKMTVVCQKRLVELITGADCLLWSHPTASFDLTCLPSFCATQIFPGSKQL